MRVEHYGAIVHRLFRHGRYCLDSSEALCDSILWAHFFLTIDLGHFGDSPQHGTYVFRLSGLYVVVMRSVPSLGGPGKQVVVL